MDETVFMFALFKCRKFDKRRKFIVETVLSLTVFDKMS